MTKGLDFLLGTPTAVWPYFHWILQLNVLSEFSHSER